MYMYIGLHWLRGRIVRRVFLSQSKIIDVTLAFSCCCVAVLCVCHDDNASGAAAALAVGQSGAAGGDMYRVAAADNGCRQRLRRRLLLDAVESRSTLEEEQACGWTDGMDERIDSWLFAPASFPAPPLSHRYLSLF